MDIADLPRLTADAERLHKQALEKIKHRKDGGSCNHDMVYFPMNRKPHPSTLAKYSQAFALVDMSCYWMSWVKGLGISMRTGGQGYLNTAVVEHVANGLKALGWNASIDYRLD